jgi:chromosome segregation ATPase
VADRDRRIGGLEEAVVGRDREITAFGVALDDLGQRVEAAQSDLGQVNGRIAGLERALADTAARQCGLESEVEETRRTVVRASEAITQRDAELVRLRGEIARRGPVGSPVAVRTALVELLQVAAERRRRRLAATQPWRLPPNQRR